MKPQSTRAVATITLLPVATILSGCTKRSLAESKPHDEAEGRQ